MIKDKKYIFAAFLPVIFWGSSFLGTRLLLARNFTPNMITFIRFGLAALLIRIFKPQKYSIEKGDHKYLAALALCGITLFYFFENTGLKYTTVTNTALITATIPLFTLIAAFFLYGKKISLINILGIICGFGGTVLLFYKDVVNSNLHIKGDLLIFGSVLMWLIYSFSYRNIMKKYKPMFILYKTFSWGALALFPFFIHEIIVTDNVIYDTVSIFSIIFLSLVCSFLAYTIWNISISKVGVKITSNIILFMPIVSIAVGVLFFNEVFGLNVIGATVFIIAGAYLTSISGKIEDHF